MMPFVPWLPCQTCLKVGVHCSCRVPDSSETHPDVTDQDTTTDRQKALSDKPRDSRIVRLGRQSMSRRRARRRR